jgi:hypothetical protein
MICTHYSSIRTIPLLYRETYPSSFAALFSFVSFFHAYSTGTIGTMRLLLPFIVFLSLVPKAEPSFGIPGTTQTISGYDTELGEDPICWRCNASTVEGDIPFPNPLIKHFKLTGEITLLKSCPALNYMTAGAPPEFQRGERLRTGKSYDYKVSITLNLDSLGGNVFTSDEGPLVAVQILLCKLGAGFCSPYIHEESNARLAAQGITESPEQGDSHGGTHTHSAYEIFKVPPEGGPVHNISMTIPMMVNTAGDYFAIAAVQMYIGSEVGEPAEMRYDMANALLQDQRLITYQEPAEILVVPDSILMASYVAIGLVSIVILFLLVETIKNRNHQVLRLTQGGFLIVFLIAALILGVSSFLLEPKNDFYCNASFPIILTSAQLLYAITLGRLWRINAVISPLLMKTLRQKTSWSSLMMESMRAASSWDVNSRSTGRRSMFRKSKNLRKQISPLKLGLVVALFTLPQVIIQVLSLVLQPQSLVIQFNDDHSQGRVMCDSGVDMKASLRDYGFWVFLLLVVLLLFMAQATSQLPSLFNESKIIYESAVFTIVLLLLGLGVIVVVDDPGTSPAAGYLVCVVWTLSIALSTSLRIMLPKLRMVWRNEKVVISTLVSDHAKSVRREDERYIDSKSNRASCVVSGLPQQEQMPSSYDISTGNSTAHSNSQEVADEMVSDIDVDYGHSHTTAPDDHDDGLVESKDPTSSGGTENMESSPDSSAEFPRPQAPPQRPKPRNEESFKRRLHALPSQRHLSHRILVKCDEPPARRLVLKMVDLQEQLAAVNERIMSGVVVSEDDWTTVRQLANRLGSAFNDDVDFAWENEIRANSARSWKNEYRSKELTVEEETEEEVKKDTVVKFQGVEDSDNESADEPSSDVV